jgi:hypothetical protein
MYCEERIGHFPSECRFTLPVYLLIRGVGGSQQARTRSLNAGTTCLARDPVLKYKQEVTDAATCWQKYKAMVLLSGGGLQLFPDVRQRK